MTPSPSEKNLFLYTVLSAAFITVSAIFCTLIFACKTAPREPQPISRTIYSSGIKSPEQLYRFFMDNNPVADRATVKRLSKLYVKEARTEGINSDIAFVQMCLETGWLKFGNLVTPEMHNYCGLGAIDKDHRGECFATEQLGVRAHIQHLHAYGTTEDIQLKNPVIDRRYKYVNPRGKAPEIWQLSGTWAADPQYSSKLDKLLSLLELY